MEFASIILFFPSSVCLCWMIFNAMAARRTSTFLIIQFLLLDLMLFSFSDACYATPGISPSVLVYTHLITLYTAPCVLPLIWMYFHKLRHRSRFHALQHAWLLAPFALLIAGIALTQTCGHESVARFLSEVYAGGTAAAAPYKGTMLWSYYLWTIVLFRILVSVELVVVLIYLVRAAIKEEIRFKGLKDFLYRGGSISVLEMQIINFIIPAIFVVFKLLFIKSFLDTHLWYSITLAILVATGAFIFLFCALSGERETVTLLQMQHIMLYNYNPAIKGPIVEIMIEELLEDAEQEQLLRIHGRIGGSLQAGVVPHADITTVRDHLFSNVVGSWDDSLMTRFQTLMLNEQLFLQPSLTLGEVADKLHTNKTYVSKMVNNTYNLGFPELMNTLRIDYAEQFILNHRDAKQEEIARACGFLSASSFNNIFKKVTGVTPRMWLAAYDRGEVKE